MEQTLETVMNDRLIRNTDKYKLKIKFFYAQFHLCNKLANADLLDSIFMKAEGLPLAILNARSMSVIVNRFFKGSFVLWMLFSNLQFQCSNVPLNPHFYHKMWIYCVSLPLSQD